MIALFQLVEVPSQRLLITSSFALSGLRRSTVNTALDGIIDHVEAQRMVPIVNPRRRIFHQRRRNTFTPAAWRRPPSRAVGVVSGVIGRPSMVTLCQWMPCRFSTAPIFAFHVHDGLLV